MMDMVVCRTGTTGTKVAAGHLNTGAALALVPLAAGASTESFGGNAPPGGVGQIEAYNPTSTTTSNAFGNGGPGGLGGTAQVRVYCRKEQVTHRGNKQGRKMCTLATVALLQGPMISSMWGPSQAPCARLSIPLVPMTGEHSDQWVAFIRTTPLPLACRCPLTPTRLPSPPRQASAQLPLPWIQRRRENRFRQLQPARL